MTHLLDRVPKHGRISVIRLRSLGDCVLTTPALQLLKQYRPDLHLEMVVEPRFAGVFAGNPDVDTVVARPSSANLVLNLHGGTRSMLLSMAAHADFRAGFAHHTFSWIYSHRIPRAQQILGVERAVHTAEHLASAMFYLGVPQADIPRARLLARAGPATESYAVLHPFASAPEKAWPVQNFVELARRLREQGLPSHIVAGPEDNVKPFASHEILKGAPLEQVKNLMAGAELFIGNDSGPAHIAAAFGVPVVVLFGPSDPVTWAPWKTEARVLTSPDTIKNILLENVWAAATELRRKTKRG